MMSCSKNKSRTTIKGEQCTLYTQCKEMESEVSQWLRKRYRPAPTDGPSAKKIKFSDIQKQLESEFPNRSFPASSISEEIKSIFPNSHSKAAGKSRQKHIFGLEEITGDPSGVGCDSDTALQLVTEREEKQQLLDKVQHLEERVLQLEQEKFDGASQLSSELLSLLQPVHAAYHGPDSITHFESFSFDVIVDEFQQLAPNLYELFKSLGGGVSTDNDVTEVRVATSLSILLKCRSAKVLGVQLLLTLMLLARATSRQVKLHLRNIKVHVHLYMYYVYVHNLHCTKQTGSIHTCA